jgi:hypothetical protein
MIDVTALKAAADAFEAAGNSVAGYKAAPTVATLAQMRVATASAVSTWNALTAAVADVQIQIDTDHSFDFS